MTNCESPNVERRLSRILIVYSTIGYITMVREALGLDPEVGQEEVYSEDMEDEDGQDPEPARRRSTKIRIPTRRAIEDIEDEI